MLRFKQFSGSGIEVEAAVNQWLAEFEPDVTKMVQTVAGDGCVSLSFLFEESFRGQELRLATEHGTSNISPSIPASSIPDGPITIPVEPQSISIGPGSDRSA